MIELHEGTSPLVLGLPHTGTGIPDDVAAGLNEIGLARADTDWHIDRLYGGMAERMAGAPTIVRTDVHRYVIDVNRDPGGASLYPGQNTTGLCPLTDFDGKPIYRPGAEPDEAEIALRRELYHAPYHAALTRQMKRVAAEHGFAVLYDCHSIRSRIPFLFDGRLPDFNIGDNGGTTCAPAITARVADICAAAEGYTHVVNGRFKGGWTTRHYGRPELGWHAIQMELAQSTYMDETPPWTWAPDKAGALQEHLTEILIFLSDWRPE